MIKMTFKIKSASLSVLATTFGFLAGSSNAAPFVYETDSQFMVTGDFNADGITDIALVERNKGCVRYAYGLGSAKFNWVIGRSAGLNNITGVAVGKFVDAKSDSLVFASADQNLVTLLGIEGRDTSNLPALLINNSIGPNLVFGTGNSGRAFDDLLVFSIYNSDPAPNHVTRLRNEGNEFTQISEAPTTFAGTRGRRLALKRGGKEYAVAVNEEAQSGRLIVRTLDAETRSTVLEIPGVTTGSDYLVGNFQGEALREFVFYQSGQPTITVCPVIEANGEFRAGDLKTFTLSKPVTHLITVDGPQRSRLLAVFGAANTAELMDFDAIKPPVTSQILPGYTNRFLLDAVDTPAGVVLFSINHSTTNDKRLPQRNATFYQAYQLGSDGRYIVADGGPLPGLEQDFSTVYQIHKNSVASQMEKIEADMKPYTNTIPGTDLDYEMVPIPGGEFTMGSPATEKQRAADEGPQHRVQVSPFWMGKYEVRWQEYVLFVYADEEIQLREKYPTPAEVRSISDAVTRPSKPYMDMSFGMGKKSMHGKGYPAIAMTQHAANKFCQWFSAKTGHFYRLPTEAEWEYAARAGTTTAYFFGDDPAELPKYAWFFENADSSYRTIGKKAANPWGLYDIYGNVAEWVLDQYDESFYKSNPEPTAISNPWNKATRPYPHVVRGGSYDDDQEKLRSAARSKSSPAWKKSDTSLPKSIWWLPDCTTVGFRIVRPLDIPPPEEMAKYWMSGVEKD